jgi:hypothetical protein
VQLVEVDGDRALADVVPDLERAPGEIDADHLVPQPDVDALLPELGGRAGHQVVE